MRKTTFLTSALVLLIAAPGWASPNSNSSANASGSVAATASGSYDLAQAQTYLDVVAELEAAGYQINSLNRTLLGRVKIMAQNRVHLRELVVSRSTGEVMFDNVVKVFPTRADSGNNAGTGEAADASGEDTANDDTGVGLSVDIGIGASATSSGGSSRAGGSLGGALNLGN